MLRDFFTNDEDMTLVDGQIEAVLEEMKTYGVAAPEYESLMTKLERLYEVKAKRKPKPISRDTLAIVAGNLVGILLIVAYEQKHVLSSKGINQIIRPMK